MANRTHVSALHQELPSPVLEHVVLLLAAVSSTFLYLSPVRSALQTLRQEVGLKELAGWIVPTYFIFAQSYLWSCYGYAVGLNDLGRYNGLGAVMCLVYLGLVGLNCHPREVVQPCIILSIMMVLTFSLGVHVLASSTEQQAMVFAGLATVFNLFMFIAPLQQAMVIVREGAFDRFPWAITIASFLSSLLWAQYSALIHDRIYLFPNLCGVVVCGFELICVSWAAHRHGLNKHEPSAAGQPLMPRHLSKTAMSNCYGITDIFQDPVRRQPAKTEALFEYYDQTLAAGGAAGAAIVGSAKKLQSLVDSWSHTGEPLQDVVLLPSMDHNEDWHHTKSPFGAREVLHNQDSYYDDDTAALSREFAAAEYERVRGARRAQGKPDDIVCIL